MIDLPPPPTYEQAIEAIVQCEIPRENVQITYQDYLQSDEIRISDIGVVTEEKLRCLKNAVHPFYVLTLIDQSQMNKFYSFVEIEDPSKRKAEAREWLRANDLLDRVPEFDPARGLGEFAAEVEKVCGFNRNSALMLLGDAGLTLDPDFIRSDDFMKRGEAVTCLGRIIAASNADEHGISLGFIGNEHIRESDEK